MKSVALLLKEQTDMIAAHAQAIRTQSFLPLSMSTGEGDQTGDDNFKHWVDHFTERAKLSKWSPEQHLYQLKAHLTSTAKQAFTMFSPQEKSSN